jgi:hypothetical protein
LYKEDEYAITVSSPCLWRASTEESWIAIKTEFAIEGKQLLVFSVASNTEKTTRQGKILIYNNEEELYAELQVIQEPSPCELGDLLEKNGVKGVVFSINEGVVKIVSVEEAQLKYGKMNEIYANDKYDGMYNMAIIKQQEDWKNKYPAFAWCADLGTDWYLPAIYELQEIIEKIDLINSTLSINTYPLISTDSYWSSSEVAAWGEYAFSGGFAQQNDPREPNFDTKWSPRSEILKVRAIYVFEH